jgi:hypothetical protein
MAQIWMIALTAGAVLAAPLAAGTAVAQDQTASPPQAEQLAAARTAAKDLGETLKGVLVQSIKSGGPVAAIAACNTIAPAIGLELSKKYQAEVGRTALRVRNAANAPDDYERRVLEEFAAKLSAGADPATLEHSETTDVNGVKTLRYMKAIPMAAEPCAACHGADLKPEVKAEIGKLYPQDQATGFKPGDLRGAFTISMPVK